MPSLVLNLLAPILMIQGFLLPFARFPSGRARFASAKWVVIDLAALLLLALFALRPFPLPHLERLRWPTLAVCLTTAFAFLVSPVPISEAELLRALSFAILILATYCAAQSCGPSALLARLFVCNSAAVILLLGTYLLGDGIQNLCVLTFGYPNLLAEFLGISLLCQLQKWRDSTTLAGRWFSGALLLALTFMLALTLCRAVALAALAGGLVLLTQSSRLPKLQWLRQSRFVVIFLLVPAAISIAISGAVMLAWPPSQGALAMHKGQNSTIRWWRWQNTAEMILEHPLGVGPGQFEIAYIPYHRRHGPDPEVGKRSLVRTAHNDYLQLAATYGIAFLLALFCWIGMAFREWRRRARVSAWPLALLTFLAVDGLFAFPSELPVTLYFGAIAVGLLLFEICPGIHPWRARRLAVLPLLALLGVLVTAETYSAFVNFAWPRAYPRVSLACRFFPSDWRQCLTKGRLELDLEDYQGAIQTAREELRRHPASFPAWELLRDANRAVGDQESAETAERSYRNLLGLAIDGQSKISRASEHTDARETPI